MRARERYDLWMKNSCFDEETRAELAEIAGDEKEIEERFGRDLEFGTGGLRGILGAGTNRMNIYTVRKATQGLADYIRKEGVWKKGAAIAFDSRHMSREFAEETALCLAANGIRANIFESLRPVPELSFALRELGCAAGIMITASHNPAEYNGYKVYWEDGAQITAPRDREIIGCVNAVRDDSQVKTMSRAEAEKAGLYHTIGAEMDDRYVDAVKRSVIHPGTLREEAADLKIVYTPLHGAGNLPVRRILKESGFTKVYVVKEQEFPDGDFPTVPCPNPEDGRAFALALALAEKVDADIVMATDPDSDRLGVYAKDERSGRYRRFTGNMVGMVLLEYILSQKREAGVLPENGAVVTTIVSGKMAGKITETYHVKLMETLTGFKYIGEQIKLFERDRSFQYLFGFEESCGCLTGTYARDKDAVAAAMAVCEAAAWYKHQNKTLCRQMDLLYEKYGYFKEGLDAVVLSGQDGIKKIREIMERLRSQIPEEIGGCRVVRYRDYKKNVLMDCVTGERSAAGLPESDVLYFELEGDGWCCIRPSGTEPKIKFYAGVRGEQKAEADQKLNRLMQAVVNTAMQEQTV